MKTLPRYLASAAMAALLIGATADVHAQTRPDPAGWDATCQEVGPAARDYRITLDRMTVRACDYQLRVKATAEPQDQVVKTPQRNPQALESGKPQMAVSLER